VRVFSNCSQVSLYRDNTLVATQSPDATANTGSLLHPPFTFSLGSYSAGTLRAAGLIGGTVTAADTVRTPGTAAAVRLRPEGTDTMAVGGSDTRLVWIDIVDDHGTVVYSSTAPVSLGISGGSIVGPTTLTMKAGQLATWVRAGTSDGAITLTANSSGLASGSMTLHSGATDGVRAPVMPSSAFAEDRPAFFRVAGSCMTLPDRFAGRTNSIAVYDLTGKLLCKAAVKGRVFSFSNDRARAAAGLKAVIVRAVQSLP
jgi:hypothetical protein